MDYKRKYKEAVNKIRNLLDDGEKNGFTIVTYKTDLESIFPELQESEDEKIRKAIIAYIKDDIEELSYEAEIEELKKYLAWLEKQGEQTWSEEDEKKFSFIRAVLIDAKSPNNCASNSTYYREVTESIDWLKSLKTRCTWKPNDEQLEIIDMLLTNETMDDNDARVLRGLEEQLKKLRGE